MFYFHQRNTYMMITLILLCLPALILSRVRAHVDVLSIGGCDSEWFIVYGHDDNGIRTEGSKEALIEATMKGAQIRVYSREWSHILKIDTAKVIKGNVCGLSIMHINKRYWKKLARNASWLFANLCTTGEVYISKWLVGEHKPSPDGGRSVRNYDLSWFIRYSGCTSRNNDLVYSTLPDGTIIGGSLLELSEAVFSGHDIKVADRLTGTVYPLQNVNLEGINDGYITGQHLWNVGMSDLLDHTDFLNDEYWDFALVSSTGSYDEIKWNVGEHFKRGEKVTYRPLDWYTDPCWMQVYYNNENGITFEGSKRMLIASILDGHRLKIITRDRTIEIDNIILLNETVKAEVIGRLGQTSLSILENNTHWYWQRIDSSGTVITDAFEVGSDKHLQRAMERQAIKWFIDNRPWKRVLAVDPDGTVRFGSKTKLIEAVTRGSVLRYVISGSRYQDYLILEADEITLGPGEDLAAQNVRAVRENNTTMYYEFTLTSTLGVIEFSNWVVDEHLGKSSKDRVYIDWFVS